MIDHLTIAMPYYDNPEMLRLHLKYWKRLPNEYNGIVEAVIVDDGSPNFPALDVLMEGNCPDFQIRLFRIQENIPWNHGGARNLAMHQADSGWTMLTDIDHVLSPGNLMDLIEQDLDLRKIYQPERCDMLSLMERVPIHPHTDSFLLTKSLFWEIGGYDEDFTRLWNGPFLPFRKAAKRISDWHPLQGPTLLRFGNKVIPDANVAEWGREGSEYDIKRHPEMRRKQKEATIKYNPINPLRFQWKQEI